MRDVVLEEVRSEPAGKGPSNYLLKFALDGANAIGAEVRG
jgi:hypothetical protein